MKLTVSLIVKNEENHLESCLNSVKGYDELIIVDTGSEDNTVEIAKKYTDKVFTDYIWKDHFADARNHALSKCTGDWILWIDADDKLLTPISKIKEKLSQLNNEVDAVKIKISSKNSYHFFPNIHKNKKEIKYKGAAHNYLTGYEKLVQFDDIIIERGFSDAHKKDPDRTLRILKKEVEKDKSKPREMFYLAREYWYKKEYELAIFWFREYLKIANWKPEKADAYLFLSRCLWLTYRGDEAREACGQAILLNPEFKEALEFMSEIHYEPMKSSWNKISKQANNQNVLFVRSKTEKKQEKTVEQLIKLDKPTNKKQHNLAKQLIVSLTSYSSRFNVLFKTLLSLLNQTIKVDKLILWVAKEDYSKLPNDVLDLRNHGLIIDTCDDIKSYKKIIPTLEKYKDSFIVTADDDTYYCSTWLEELISNWSGDYKEVVCHRGHRITFNKNNFPKEYSKWILSTSNKNSLSKNNFPTGQGGIFYPPNIFHEKILDIKKALELCPTNDDIWIYWMHRKNDSIIRALNYLRFETYNNSQDVALYKENVLKQKNDEQIKKMIQHYRFPK